MSTKTEIGTVIDTNMASTDDITAVEHRDTLKDNADSLKENFYAKAFQDDETDGTFFTLQDIGSATFDLTIIKQGREVTVDFIVTAILDITRLGNFTAGELTIISGATYYSVAQNVFLPTKEGVEVRDVSGTTSIFFTNAISAGDTILFSITYNTAA